METKEKNSCAHSDRKPAKRDPKGSRQALIDATLDTIADIGLTDTTVTHIIRRAGLSRGMVHLHFGGKDNLLTAAAKHFSDAYYAVLDRHLDGAGTAPETIIMAVIRADLGEELLNERSTRIWHAFRGAAPTHKGIARYSSTQDARLTEILQQAFEDVSGSSEPAVRQTALQATFGTFALLEGMWVHFLSDMENFSREEAVELVRKFLAGMYPGHFKATGTCL